VRLPSIAFLGGEPEGEPVRQLADFLDGFSHQAADQWVVRPRCPAGMAVMSQANGVIVSSNLHASPPILNVPSTPDSYEVGHDREVTSR
jgi:hypothetical protein